MFFLVDIIALAFILLLSLLGLKLGFFKSTVDVVLVLVCFAGSIVGAYFLATSYLEPKLGWITELKEFFINLLGDSKIQGGQPIVEQTAYWLGFGSLIFILFILFTVVLNLVRKLIIAIFSFINKFTPFGFIDRLLGFVVNLAASTAIVLLVMAAIHGLSSIGLLVHANEVLLSSELLSLVHEVNPLNNILAPVFENLKSIIPAGILPA